LHEYLWIADDIALLALCAAAWTAAAQEAPKPAYLDPSLPAEQRAADLVHRLTLEEKATQLVNQARAIPRLNVPAYDWWSESLHGVLRNGTTEFPEPIGLGATFDAPAIHEMAVVIGTEGASSMCRRCATATATFSRAGFLAPNINIFRDPRWGRARRRTAKTRF